VSLCPNYCECRSCKHGVKVCEGYEYGTGCRECQAEQERRLHQTEHEASVKRQRAKIKKAPWYQP
jgi:hypothetical protein